MKRFLSASLAGLILATGSAAHAARVTTSTVRWTCPAGWRPDERIREPNCNVPVPNEQQAESERLKAEADRQKQALDAQKAEADRKQQEELAQKAEADRQRQQEFDAQKAEADKQRQQDLEAQKADADKQKQEYEAKLAAEAEKQKQALEAQQAEATKQKQELEAQLEAEKTRRAEEAAKAVGTQPIFERRVAFGAGTAEIPAAAKPALKDVAQKIKSSDEIAKVHVGGHADNTGSPELNEKLSTKRAEAVRDFLIKSGVSEDLVEVDSYSDEEPVASNETPDGRALNRSVVIIALK